jgi:hypothetical protein
MKEINLISTSIEQSKRLIKLGIKESTADMWWDLMDPDKRRVPISGSVDDYVDIRENEYVPAWSLGKLINMCFKSQLRGVSSDAIWLRIYPRAVQIYKQPLVEKGTEDIFDNLIKTIEWLIEENYFNKEYLCSHNPVL